MFMNTKVVWSHTTLVVHCKKKLFIEIYVREKECFSKKRVVNGGFLDSPGVYKKVILSEVCDLFFPN